MKVKKFVEAYLKKTAVVTVVDDAGGILSECEAKDIPEEVLEMDFVSLNGLGELGDIFIVCKEPLEEYSSSSTYGDYSPSNPWDAPGMSARDFI